MIAAFVNKNEKYMLKKLLFVFVFFSTFFLSQGEVYGAYNASYVLGQLDHNGDPSFTQGNENGNLRDMGFQQSQGIVIDEVQHRLYVSDSVANRIMVFNLDTNNEFTDNVADFVLGQTNFNDFNSATSDTGLKNPLGMAIDSTGQRLFVADAANFRVLVYDVSTLTNGEAAVNVLGQTDFTTATTGLSQSKFALPTAVEFDSANDRLFVADASNRRVLIFDVSTITDGENAINVLGQTLFTTNVSGSALDQMSFPQDIAYDQINDRLFVVNFNTGIILVHDTSAIVNGQSALDKFGSADLTFSGLGGEAIEYDYVNERLYVSHTNRNRVLVYDVSTITTDETAVNVLGQPDLTTVLSNTTQNGLNGPERLYFYGTDELLYIIDSLNNRIIVQDVSSITNGQNAADVIGQYDINGLPDFTSSDAYDSSTGPFGFASPSSVVIDSDGHRLFVSDSTLNRILIFQLDAQNIPFDYVADFVLGQTDFSGRDPGLSGINLSSPHGMVFDQDNQRLFVADSSNNRVLIYDVSSLTNGEAAVNVLGQPDFSTDTPDLTQSSFSYPFDLAYDALNQRLFVLDNGNTRIMVYDVNSITDGENAVNVLGAPNFVTPPTYVGTQSTFNAPTGLTYDPDLEYLFVSDESDSRIMIFDVSALSDGENAINVLGQPDFSTFGINVTADGLAGPYGMAIDTNTHRLLVSDSYVPRLLFHDLDTLVNGQNASNVIGQNDFVTSAFNTTQDGLSGIQDIDYDFANNLVFAADTSNSRVLIYRFLSINENSLANGTVGSAYSQNLSVSDEQGGESFQITGTLPTGLNLAGGVISGTPTTSGASNFSLQAIDTLPTGNFFSLFKNYVVNISPAAVVPPTTPSGRRGGSGCSNCGEQRLPSPSPDQNTPAKPDQTQHEEEIHESPVDQEQEECLFNDLENGSPIELIERFHQLKVVQGKLPCQFFPKDYLKRAEAVKIALLAFKLPHSETPNPNLYNDIEQDSWYGPYLQAAKAQNIAVGFHDGSFHPNDDVQIVELLKIFFNAKGCRLTESETWYEVYVSKALELGIISPEMSSFDFISRENSLVLLNSFMNQKACTDL